MTPSTGCAVNDVLFTSADFYPTARCADDSCGAQPHAAQGPGVAKRWAREHVARTGHEVLVTQETLTTYYPPGRST